jgi:hypothetical protein
MAENHGVDFCMAQLLGQTDRHQEVIELMKRVISPGPC